MTELIQRNLQDIEISRTGTRVKFWPDKEGLSVFFLKIEYKDVGWANNISNFIIRSTLFCLILCIPFAVFVSTTAFDYQVIAGRVRELAFLNPEV